MPATLHPAQRAMPSRKTLIGSAVAFALVLAGSLGAYDRIRAHGEAAAADSASAPGAEVPGGAAEGFSTEVAIPVRGAPTLNQALVMSVSAAGQAEAWRRTAVTAQVGGRVGAIPVGESQAVGQGQLLAALDPAEYGLKVEEARAALAEAEGRFQEMMLFNDRIQDAEVRRQREAAARSRSGLDAAQVRLRSAELELARTRLAAPFAGRIASLKVVPGQWVQPGTELMTLVDLDPIKVEVQVLESEVGHLAPGRRASVSFAAFPEEAFTGRVETINPVVDAQTRTAKVTVLIPNPGGRILPGMYARVQVEARRFEDRVIVPRSAILERDRRTMLFVFEPEEEGSDRGLAKWRYVRTGLQNDAQVEIVDDPDTEGVRPGETVLVEGHQTLIHDARVRLVEDVEEQGGRPG